VTTDSSNLPALSLPRGVAADPKYTPSQVRLWAWGSSSWTGCTALTVRIFADAHPEEIYVRVTSGNNILGSQLLSVANAWNELTVCAPAFVWGTKAVTLLVHDSAGDGLLDDRPDDAKAAEAPVQVLEGEGRALGLDVALGFDEDSPALFTHDGSFGYYMSKSIKY